MDITTTDTDITTTAPESSYRVVFIFVDRFGFNQRVTSETIPTVGEARDFATEKFAEQKPDAWWITEERVVEYHDCTPVPPKPLYGMRRMNNEVRVFTSKTAAVKYNRELPPLALQYRKGVLVSHDDGKSWEHFA